MKKVISLILAGIISVGALTSCSTIDRLGELYDKKNETTSEKENEKVEEVVEKETDTLTLETEAVIADYASISLISIKTDKEVKATMHNGIFYENSTEGNVYVDAMFEVVNLSKEDIQPGDLLRAYAVGDGGTEYNSSLYCIETNSLKSVSAYDSMKPLAKNKYHAAVSVPESETVLTLYYEFENIIYTYKYNLGETVKVERALEAGAPLEIEGYGVLEYVDYTFTDKVLPSDISDVYSTYVCDSEDNTYLVLNFNLTNLGADERRIDDLLFGKVCFMGFYEYSGFVATEDSDLKGFGSSNKVIPLQNAHALCIIEIPDAVVTDEFEATIVFNGTEYTVRGTAE